MKKFYLFDYLPSPLYGDSLQDALERQHTLNTPVATRRVANPTYNGTDATDRYAYARDGGDKVVIGRVVEIDPPAKNTTRGGKTFERAVIELADRRIITVDVYTEQTAAAATLGSSTSPAKRRASAANGQRGGRPRKAGK